MEEKTISPEEVAKETSVEETPEEVVEESKTKTVEEVINQPEDDKVPLSTFLEIKNEKKKLEKELEKVRRSAEQGATKSEVKSDLKAIAEKYDVDPDFLQELSSAIYVKAKEEAETAIKPILEENSKEKLDKILMDNINNTLETMPEYDGIANKEVIKSLAKLPENKNKTFQQIIEETYGKSVSGKKTMETSTPRGGKDVGIDWNKVSDPSYFKQIMADPELKKQYNEKLANRIIL